MRIVDILLTKPRKYISDGVIALGGGKIEMLSDCFPFKWKDQVS